MLTDDELAAEVKNPMCRVNFRDDYDALYDMLPQRSFSAETFLRQFYQWFPRKFVADQVPTFFVDGGRITRLVPAAEINSGLIPWDSSAALITPLSPSYGKNYKRMSPVGTNDRFDQIICRAARRAGIDTIVLLFEQGDSRAATEILCTDEDPYKRLAWRAKVC